MMKQNVLCVDDFLIHKMYDGIYFVVDITPIIFPFESIFMIYCPYICSKVKIRLGKLAFSLIICQGK